MYDVSDTGNTTPLPLKDLSGRPLRNPLTSSADAFLPEFTTTSPQVKLVAGTLAVSHASYKALLAEARAAKEFVQGIGVAGTTTAEAGAPAAATIDGKGQFAFTIPKGDTGAKGDKGEPGVWTLEFQAQQQGFWPVYSDTPPAVTEMYGVPVVWMTPAQKPTPVPALPQAPLWNDTATTATIPSGMVGIEYQSVSGEVLPQGSVVNGTKGKDLIVNAVALPGYVLPTAYQWKHKFLDPSKATLVASDTFSGPRTPSLIGRTMDNLAGGAANQAWRGYRMDINPRWTPPNLDWRGGGCTGLSPSGSASLKLTPIGAPVDPTVTTSASGGVLAAATYWYMVTAVMAVGETGCRNQKSVVAIGSTSSNTITWPLVSGAASINIWRGTSTGGEKLLASLPGSATS
ncbi:hypothetical protein [Sinomonas humi]|uniref:Uncharacterized protein n=1 Tax=Sinomonas humi TaxID=1338436 RepID=A0A0B2AJD9_9MICC|nr:hypothetical protein [Sinomonas humi]KHL01921.1 hypothetical protein LK10_14260 [Sinomonas humi]